MPSKNIIKSIAPYSFVHVYNRGVEKKAVFEKDCEKQYFLDLFDRYLNPLSVQTDADNKQFVKFDREIELQSFCVMPNHYHLLFWVGENPGSLSGLMRCIGTSYASYYNKKHDRVGPLFQSRYKASPIHDNNQLIHVSRYIHLNPHNFMEYKYSSLSTYLNGICPEWLNPHRTLEALDRNDYLAFLKSA